jgi:hypothetical protein
MEEMRNACNILDGISKGKRDHLGDIGTYMRLVLKWILKKQIVRMWSGFI